MADTDHPRVLFRTMQGLQTDFREGYLCIIDGASWLAATLEEAQSKIPATMRKLDVKHLEEQRDDETGEKYFLYRDVLDR